MASQLPSGLPSFTRMISCRSAIGSSASRMRRTSSGSVRSLLYTGTTTEIDALGSGFGARPPEVAGIQRFTRPRQGSAKEMPQHGRGGAPFFRAGSSTPHESRQTRCPEYRTQRTPLLHASAPPSRPKTRRDSSADEWILRPLRAFFGDAATVRCVHSLRTRRVFRIRRTWRAARRPKSPPCPRQRSLKRTVSRSSKSGKSRPSQSVNSESSPRGKHARNRGVRRAGRREPAATPGADPRAFVARQSARTTVRQRSKSPRRKRTKSGPVARASDENFTSGRLDERSLAGA